VHEMRDMATVSSSKSVMAHRHNVFVAGTPMQSYSSGNTPIC